MSMELSLVLVALVPIIVRAWIGWRRGASFEVRSLIVYLFATLAAVRFWYPASRALAGWVPLDPQFLAAVVFGILFLAAMIPAALAVNLRGPVIESVSANPVNTVCGALAGILSGSLISGALLAIAVLVLPSRVEGFDPEKMPVWFDGFSVTVFRAVESRIARVPSDDPAHSPLPHVLPAAEQNAPPLIVWK